MQDGESEERILFWNPAVWDWGNSALPTTGLPSISPPGSHTLVGNSPTASWPAFLIPWHSTSPYMSARLSLPQCTRIRFLVRKGKSVHHIAAGYRIPTCESTWSSQPATTMTTANSLTAPTAPPAPTSTGSRSCQTHASGDSGNVLGDSIQLVGLNQAGAGRVLCDRAGDGAVEVEDVS